MKKLMLCTALVLSLSACQSVPPLVFTPSEGAVVVAPEQRLDADLRSITVTAAKSNEQTGRLMVGFAGNQYESSYKEAFKSALEEAIIRSTLFRDSSTKKLSLSAKVLEFNTPEFSVTFPSKAVVRYQLINRETSAIVYDQQIVSTASVNMGYALYGKTRAHEARNRAMQANIANFLNDLKVRGISKE